ncbi:MAG: hypothetical protein EOO22_23010, partial [Comamonadaceae bacterium]
MTFELKTYETLQLAQYGEHVLQITINRPQAMNAITTQMGPSPQLVAFVNYDRVTPDSLGLESFNIMDQHEQIVEHIGTDTSMHLAIEGLLSKLFGEKIPLRSEFVSFQDFHTHTIN